MIDQPKEDPGVAVFPSRRRIGSKEFASTLGTNVAIQGFTILQGILLARLLGPVGRGQFTAAILWPSLFAAMSGMGVGVALARRAGRANDLAKVTRTGLLLSIMTAALGTAVCGVALAWLLPHEDDLVRWAAYAFLPFIFFNQIALAVVAVDQGAGWFGRMNWTRLIVNPVYLGMIIALWLAGIRDVRWFVVGLLIANGVVAIARIILAIRQGALFGPIEPIKSFLYEALPFGLAGVLIPVTQWADRALLLYLLGTTQLGFYTVALTAATVVNSLAGAAGTVSFGMSTQTEDRAGFERIARMFRFTAWIWLLAGFGVAVAIPIMLPLLYGADFRPAIWPAIVLIPAAAFSGQASILEEAMRAQGRAFIGLEARAVGLIAMLVLTSLLVHRFGILGVAFAGVGSQAAVLLIMMVASRGHFHRGLFLTLLPRFEDLAELKRRAFRLLNASDRTPKDG